MTGTNGTGTALAATDGAFNSTSEGVNQTLTAAQFNALTQGTHTVYVHESDVSNRWSGYTSKTFVKDTVAPTATVNAFTSLSADTGTSATDFITSTTTQTVKGTFTGTLASGETIQVSANGGTSWVTATISGANWTATSVTLLAGTNSLTTRTIDTAGNTTTGASRSYTLDTVAPTATVNAVTSLSVDSGSSPTDFITNTANQTVSGSFTGTLVYRHARFRRVDSSLCQRHHLGHCHDEWLELDGGWSDADCRSEFTHDANDRHGREYNGRFQPRLHIGCCDSDCGCECHLVSQS